MKHTFRTVVAAVMLAAASIAPAAAQSLTTTYAAGNGQAGNTFDLRANSDLNLDRFDIHLGAAGDINTIAVYWRTGTSNGFDSNASGWTLLGKATVVSNGEGTPTPLPIGGLRLAAGQTYGIYLHSETGQNLRYTNGANVFSTEDLSLTTWHGKGNPAFTSETYTPRQWNGTVHYSRAFTSCAAEGYTGAKLTMCRSICETTQSPATLTNKIKLYTAIYRETPPCGR